jgi:hypothetical protein
MAARCCRRSRGGHGEGAVQGGEGRGGPERRVDDEAVQTASSGGVRSCSTGEARGVRKLQEIVGIGSSGRSSPGSGGRWRCSAGIRMKERLPVGGDGGPGAGSGGKSWALERGSRRGVETGE